MRDSSPLYKRGSMTNDIRSYTKHRDITNSSDFLTTICHYYSDKSLINKT